jgi:hypothetical protein
VLNWYEKINHLKKKNCEFVNLYPKEHLFFVPVPWLHPLVLLKKSEFKAWTGPEGSRRMRLPDFKTIGT